jgi:hypothetical protein
VTAATVAVKVTVVAPAATVTLVGTATEALLLERVTAIPPVGAAAFNVTVQLSVPAPVMDALVQLRALNAAGGVSCKANVLETPFADAVRVAVWAEENAATVAVKLAVVALAAIVTEAGTVTDALLLDRLTVTPLVGAGADRIALQLSVPAPVKELVTHESWVSAAG